MKLFFRENGTLGTYSRDNNLEAEDTTLTAYVVDDSFNIVSSEAMTDNGPVTTYITHAEFLQQQGGN